MGRQESMIAKAKTIFSWHPYKNPQYFGHGHLSSPRRTKRAAAVAASFARCGGYWFRLPRRRRPRRRAASTDGASGQDAIKNL